jgi:hypothetical protein
LVLSHQPHVLELTLVCATHSSQAVKVLHDGQSAGRCGGVKGEQEPEVGWADAP